MLGRFSPRRSSDSVLGDSFSSVCTSAASDCNMSDAAEDDLDEVYISLTGAANAGDPQAPARQARGASGAPEGAWTDEEDARLMGMFSSVGGKWDLISKAMLGRTNPEVRARVSALQAGFTDGSRDDRRGKQGGSSSPSYPPPPRGGSLPKSSKYAGQPPSCRPSLLPCHPTARTGKG